jgi:acyl-CoA thioesterase I
LLSAALAAGQLAGGCRAETVVPPPTEERVDRPATGGARPAPPPLAVPADAPLVAFLGDSVTAGLHVASDEAFPAALQRRLASEGVLFRVANAGVSGDTTSGGRTRADWVLDQRPAVLVVALGANDGFRGVPPATVEENLRAIVARALERGVRPLLCGVRLPPNYGPDYVREFEALYERVARDLGVAYVPYFMEGVAGVPDMNLPDGIHPTPEGHERLAANLAEALAGLLR